MIDYLRGVWVPGEDEEDDEEDAAGIVQNPPEDAEEGDEVSQDAPEPAETLPFSRWDGQLRFGIWNGE